MLFAADAASSGGISADTVAQVLVAFFAVLGAAFQLRPESASRRRDTVMRWR